MESDTLCLCSDEDSLYNYFCDNRNIDEDKIKKTSISTLRSCESSEIRDICNKVLQSLELENHAHLVLSVLPALRPLRTS